MEPVHESEVLRRLEPSIRNDENEWPQFPLRDVVVESQKTGRPISLLQAHKMGKVRVTGILHDQDADEDSRKRFKKRFHKQQRVYIQDVDMYSYGKYDDDSLAFWAAGEAGWFELRTLAPTYKATYGLMEEATNMLYFFVGKASRQRRDWKMASEKNVKDIMRVTLTDFVSSDLNKRPRTDLQDTAEGFTEHRHFLIKCMLEGAEGVDWANTPFLRWYESILPNDVRIVKEVVDQTGFASLEDLLDQPVAPALKTRGRPTTGSNLDVEMSTYDTTGRRSKRLAALEDEGNSSEELSNQRGRARGKHKRKSMLRIPGSAKTPRKTHVKKYDEPRAYPLPDMEHFREAHKFEEQNLVLPDRPAEEETTLDSGLLRDLQFSELNPEEEVVTLKEEAYMKVQEPSGTWTCPYDGCSHNVWDAQSELGKELIKKHYALKHQESIEELIKSESRPWAKTSYLLEKVRGMQALGNLGTKVEAKAEPQVEVKENVRVSARSRGRQKHEDDDLVFVQPIKRKY